MLLVKEDRAPLGSDPSALAMPHRIGLHPYPVLSFIKYAGGSNAINPRRKAAVSSNFSGVDLIFIKSNRFRGNDKYCFRNRY